MSQLMFEDIVDFVEDYPREFRAQFISLKGFEVRIRSIIELFHQKRQEVFDNPSQRAAEKLERLKSLDSEYLGKAEELQLKKLQILRALKHAVTVVQRKITDSVDAHRQELRFEHPGAAERIEFDSRQLDIDQDATVKQIYKDLVPPSAASSSSHHHHGGHHHGHHGHHNQHQQHHPAASVIDYVPTYFKSPLDNVAGSGGTAGSGAAGAAGSGGALAAGAANAAVADDNESLGSTNTRVRSDGGVDGGAGGEKKRGRGRPRRPAHSSTKDNNNQDGDTFGGSIDDDMIDSPAVPLYGKSSSGAPSTSAAAKGGAATEEDSWCFCKQPSFGFMVACDAKDCQIEWFHGECVHVTEEQMHNVGQWFCPMCKEKMSQLYAGNTTMIAEPFNNSSNLDANEHMETLSQTTTASRGGGGRAADFMHDDEASSSTMDGFVGGHTSSSSASRQRKRIVFDGGEHSKASSTASSSHNKKKKQQQQVSSNSTSKPNQIGGGGGGQTGGGSSSSGRQTASSTSSIGNNKKHRKS